MTSFEFLIFICIFLPAVMLAYHLVGERHRWVVLLAASYAFIAVNSGFLAVFIIISTLTVYFAARWMGTIESRFSGLIGEAPAEERKSLRKKCSKRKRYVLALSVAINLGILIHLKYSAFFCSAFNGLFEKTGNSFRLPVKVFALPIGISFYTMMAMSYVIDVYRGTVTADRNLGRVSLFLCFFPQIMEGPICRYGETAAALFECRDIEYKNLTYGLQRISFGMAKRMLIADRVNNFIGWGYSFPDSYDGGMLAVASLCYSFQIYADFSGTMDIVIGTAEIFGIKLPENFRQPFFSKSISEFWTRWHISLGRWFSDYLFYPVSMSGSMKKLTKSARKKLGTHYATLLTGSIALLAVWICNGLWHGSGWQFIVFGLYHFTFIFLGSLTEPLRRNVSERLKINRESTACRVLCMIRTFIIFNFGEIFFRSPDLKTANGIIGKIFTGFTFKGIAGGALAKYWLDSKDIVLLLICAAALIIIGAMKASGHDIRAEISKLSPWTRYAIYASIIVIAIVFGGYGQGYSYVEPIYANF